MPSSMKFRVRDYDGEKSVFELPGIAIDEDNFAAGVADLTNMISALALITIGSIEHAQYLVMDDNVGGIDVTNAFAQRETKWLVTARGNGSEKLYHREVPCANLALLQAGTDEMAAGTQRTQFTSMFETIFRGDNDETATIVSIKHVGRNT